MSIFNLSFLTRNSKTADTAKERLQILVAHDRASAASADLVPVLKKEILEVVRKHLSIERDKVDVRLDREGECSSLEINIELPEQLRMAAAARHA